MATLKGPLHSLTASGSLGQSLTFLQSKGRAIGKKKSKPGGQASPAQLARRALYKQCTNAWNALDSGAKATWNAAGQAAQISGFNAFMAWALKGGISAGSTTWDAGATTWDNGSTYWD